jgi:hypothetical protein
MTSNNDDQPKLTPESNCDKQSIDQNVCDVVNKHLDRARVGLVKYKVTTERSDLTILQWLQHLQDELMDATIYNQKLQSELPKISQFLAWCHHNMRPRHQCYCNECQERRELQTMLKEINL